MFGTGVSVVVGTFIIVLVLILAVLLLLMPLFVYQIKQSNEKLVEEAAKTRREIGLLSEALAANQAKLHRAIDIFTGKP